MKLSLITLLFILTLVVSCNSNSHPPLKSSSAGKQPEKNKSYTSTKNNPSFYQIDGDSILVSPFQVEISLSDKARERIASKNETIIVFIFLTGTPKDPSKANFEEDGSFFVGSAQKEILYGQTARFDNLKFPKKIYDQLADKDVDFGLNVYTGRKTSPDNLLDCEALFDKMSNVVGKTFTLKGKLIYGDD